jgi:heme/copper-type cytochrome/quinol oxidase subunit 4
MSTLYARGSSLINLLIGGILGMTITTIGFDLIQNSDRNLTIQTITNIVIALATVVAVAINYFTIKSQKEGRRWEINKDILIKVSTTLSDLMSQTRKLSDNAFNDMQGIPEEHNFAQDNSIYKKFEQYLEHTVDVYGLLLNKEIISAIDIYRKADSNITHTHELGVVDIFETYDASYGAQKELMKILNKNIKKYAAL